jgi:hypothetical protein
MRYLIINQEPPALEIPAISSGPDGDMVGSTASGKNYDVNLSQSSGFDTKSMLNSYGDFS